jgi:ketosteroid isomerase-like protein
MLEAKNIEAPDEKYTFEHGEVQIVNLTGMTVGRATFRPGWQWSTDVKPVVGTSSCQIAHSSYVVSGRFHVRMDDGTEVELGPGDAHVVSPGHDAWVVGDEPCVAIDFSSTGGLLGGRVLRCPCGVEFRVAEDHQLDHLVAAVQEHASASHGHQLTRDHVLAEVGVGFEGARDAGPERQDENAIRRVIEAYGDRLRAGDVAGIVSLYTHDATVMAPDLATASGTARISDVYTAALDACGMDYKFEFDAVHVSGDSAVARTRTTGATTVRASGAAVPGRNRELFVLRRAGEEWLISEYMFQPQPTGA